MPNSAQLIARGRELASELDAIEADTALSATDKGARLEAIGEAFKDHKKNVDNSERAQEMRQSLGEPEMAAKGGDGAALPRFEVPNLNGLVKGYAKAVLRNPEYRDIVQALEGAKGTGSRLDRGLHISLKDATEADNVMAETYFGSGSSEGLQGSSLFLPGAFGPAIAPQFLPGFVEQRVYELTVADLFTNMPVDVPIVTYPVQSTVNWQAAPAAEGGLYPFSSTQFTREQEEIGKVANAMTISDETIRDAASLFTFLQGELVLGVQRQEEVQILAGDSYPGVNGLLNRASSFTMGQTGSAVLTQNATFGNATGAGMQPITVSSLPYGRLAQGTGDVGIPPSAVEIAETLLTAMIDIQLSIFFSPNAIIMNPRDYLTLRLSKDNNGQYYGGSMWGTTYGYSANQGNGYLGDPGAMLWNTKVVQTPTVPQGTYIVGYFGPECTKVLRRDGISLEMTNANGTDFVQGKVTMRAEERIGLMVQRPLAFQLVATANAPA